MKVCSGNLINQPFVIKEPKLTWVKMDDVRRYLHISEDKWIGKSKEITDILKTLGWEKWQAKREGKNLRAYKLNVLQD